MTGVHRACRKIFQKKQVRQVHYEMQLFCILLKVLKMNNPCSFYMKSFESSLL